MTQPAGLLRAAGSINLSLPSLRADNFPEELAERLKAVRMSGLTFAPEAGTQRLRDVINKNLTEEEILHHLPDGLRQRLERRQAVLHAGSAHRD